MNDGTTKFFCLCDALGEKFSRSSLRKAENVANIFLAGVSFSCLLFFDIGS